MTIDREGQWELSYQGRELLFGEASTGHPRVAFPDLGDASLETQDLSNAGADGVQFGEDLLGGRTITFETAVNRTGDPEPSSAVSQAAKEFIRIWHADPIRRTPGAVAELRTRRGGQDYVVYGRPGKIAETRGGTFDVGWKEFLHSFRCSDHLFYRDQKVTEAIPIVPSSSGGMSTEPVAEEPVLNQNRNPSAEVDTALYNGSRHDLTRDTTWSEVGAASFRFAVNATDGSSYLYPSATHHPSNRFTVAPDEYVSTRVRVRALRDTGIRLRLVGYGADNAGVGTFGNVEVNLLAGEETTLELIDQQAPADATGYLPLIYAMEYNGGVIPSQVGDTFLFDGFINVNYGSEPSGLASMPYFDGNTPDDPIYTYRWQGEPHASTSVKEQHTGGFVFPLSTDEETYRSFYVNNEGTEDTWAIVKFQGPNTNPRCDTDMGWSVWLEHELASDEEVTIDPRPWKRTVTNNFGASLPGTLRGVRMEDMKVTPNQHEVVHRGTDPTGTAVMYFEFNEADGMI